MTTFRQPFRHGVASGDPLSDRVVLWTRIRPDAPEEPVEVAWRIARDGELTDVVADGAEVTTESRASPSTSTPRGSSRRRGTSTASRRWARARMSDGRRPRPRRRATGSASRSSRAPRTRPATSTSTRDIYRALPFGDLADLFMLDGRTKRRVIDENPHVRWTDLDAHGYVLST